MKSTSRVFANSARFALIATVPALAIGLLFESFLGYRNDYGGHYFAGYGGTLIAVLLMFFVQGPLTFRHYGAWSVVVMCGACILLGTVAEATIFRIAKFDEIDLCNQSIGAVLAGVVALSLVGPVRPHVILLVIGFGVGFAALMLGVFLAFS